MAVYLLYHLTTVTQKKGHQFLGGAHINLPLHPWVMGYSRPGNSVEQDRFCSQSIAIAPLFFPSKDNLLSILLRQSQSRKTQQTRVPLHHSPSPTKSDRIHLDKWPLNFRFFSLPSVTRHRFLSQSTPKHSH